MTVTGLQKVVDDLQKKAAADTAKKDMPASAAPAKDASKDVKDTAPVKTTPAAK
jgi:hypothetical protein